MTIEDLFTQYYAPIQHYLYNRLGDYELAEDLTQEVFIKAVEALPFLPWRTNNLYGWVFTIAKRKCIDAARHQKLLSFVEIEDWHQTADLPDVDMQEQIARAWDILPEHYRIPLYLYYMQDYSIRKIAATLHASPSTIKTRLMRGRNLFKEQYQMQEEGIAA